MRRRIAAPAVAVVAAGLLLTACSSDGGGDEGELPGLGGGQAQEEKPLEPEDDGEGEEVEPADDGIERPDIQVADGLELIFEDRETGDPLKDAVLLDNEWQIKAVYEVLTSHDTENGSIYFYTRSDALDWDVDFIGAAVDKGLTSAGVMRYFNRDVTLHEGGDSATVVYCRDFAEVYTKDIATGEVTDSEDPDAEPTYYEAYLKRNEQGVWQTLDRNFERGSVKC